VHVHAQELPPAPHEVASPPQLQRLPEPLNPPAQAVEAQILPPAAPEEPKLQAVPELLSPRTDAPTDAWAELGVQHASDSSAADSLDLGSSLLPGLSFDPMDETTNFFAAVAKSKQDAVSAQHASPAPGSPAADKVRLHA
jgi:hypothetical protein